MPMSIVRSDLNLPKHLWKAAKTAFGGAVFVAMCLPLAFPAKVGASTLAKPAPVYSQPSPQAVPARAPAAAKASPASQVATQTAQLPVRKPAPKNT